MSDLFGHLVNLLGTPIENPDFQDFLNDCGEKPEFCETKLIQDYAFLKLGLHIEMDKQQNQIKSLFFHFITVAVRAGEVEPFAQTLPFGILPKDSREVVKQKIGVKRNAKKIMGRTSSAPKDFWDSYEIPPLEYTFMFNGGDKRLGSISVYYTINPVATVSPSLQRLPLHSNE